jgi:phenylacetate-CoA ligase
MNGLYPAIAPDLYRGLGERLREYWQMEDRTLEENKETQWQSLLKILQHANQTTSFYRKRFAEAGFRPASISSPEDLRMIPSLSRDDIRNHLDELCSDRIPKSSLREAHTGGTTDTPVRFLRDPAALREKTAVQTHLNSWAGFLPGDKVLHLWGAMNDYPQNPSWRWKIYDRYVMRQMWAPASLLREEALEQTRRDLDILKPRVIYAYPTPLALFCEYLRDSGRQFHRPVSAICTAESLLDSQRQLIQDVLGCPVFEHYGSRESGMIAAECEYHRGLHLNTAAAYVEFVPVENAGETGLCDVFITDLLNYGMPLIRYRINDCGIQSTRTCPCGRGFPLIDQIVGRKTDVFWLPNGEAVPGISLTRLMLAENCPGIKKIQLIQHQLDSFSFRFVAGADFAPENIEIIRRNIDRFFPPGLQWSFERVDKIERERSGKTRYCISYVSRPPVKQIGTVSTTL